MNNAARGKTMTDKITIQMVLNAATRNHADGSLPVIFNGANGAELLGYTADIRTIDNMLRNYNRTCTKISRATFDLGDTEFFICH